ncbi:nucleoside hydrolase [Streptobacillus felis]|uniref:Nucleoside hydrolase n=1 Tax=Streptobacillus felis TaxID=1384509 RepID=A0A7Z0T7Y2_9FUSO|nr:nucleoside hydrolase [Streptobacillus felis]NYV27304.1 nucleoside hydrolase [Streptobacillus felis]
MLSKIPLIIDTDPGIDDAAALICAINSNNKLDIKLITTVFGNVSLEKTTNNALKILEFMGKDIPVAKGSKKGILFEGIDASEVHGDSGMDGYEFKEPKIKALEIHAIEAMRNVILNTEDKITIATLGSLTNVALLLLVYPEVKNKIREIVIMGGSLTGGNTTTGAEFNIYNDPHAAKIVFDSGIEVTVLSLDITRRCLISNEKLNILKNGTEVSKMCYALFENYRSEGIEKGLMMHDSTVIAYLTNKEMFTYEYKYIDVILEGSAVGTLVADYYTNIFSNKVKNVKYVVDVNEKVFEEWLIDKLK